VVEDAAVLDLDERAGAAVPLERRIADVAGASRRGLRSVAASQRDAAA
jgi:hypothetical protein